MLKDKVLERENRQAPSVVYHRFVYYIVVYQLYITYDRLVFFCWIIKGLYKIYEVLKGKFGQNVFSFSNQEPIYTTCIYINLEIKAIYSIECMHYFTIENVFNSSIHISF